MNTIYTVNRSKGKQPNFQIAHQRGFFSIGVGLGLTALFALFGSALEPGQVRDSVEGSVVTQEKQIDSQRVAELPGTYAIKHQL
ncbi:MAG: hypothetical protein GY806_22180 [Gammaproteobacteria bacterium]|nr:hypothetical protein [Gammaproteobacteria bacterium]